MCFLGFGDYDYSDLDEAGPPTPQGDQQQQRLPGFGGPDDFGEADVEGQWR